MTVSLGIDPGLADLDTATAAYLAGLIDGEGYVGVKRRLPSAANRMRAPRYALAVYVGMTDREPIDLVAAAVGARVHTRARSMHKPLHEVHVEQARAEWLLRQILPYLRAKRLQADAALQLAALQATSRQHRTKELGRHRYRAGNNRGHEYRVLGLSDEYLAQCDELYLSALRLPAPRSGNAARFAQ